MSRRVVVVLDVEAKSKSASFRAVILRGLLERLLGSQQWDYRFKVVSVSRVDEDA